MKKNRHADHTREYKLNIGKTGLWLDECAHAATYYKKPKNGPRQCPEETAFFSEKFDELSVADDIDRTELNHRCAL